MNLSVVIPVYNSQESLALLVQELVRVLAATAQAHEIILIDDGSPDNSWQIIQELAQHYPTLRGIHLRRNYGQHNALLCGIRAAQYPVIVTMDDDLQHPPSEMPKLLSKLNEGYDLVYGTPPELPHSYWRNFFSRTTKIVLAKATGIPSIRYMDAYRAFRTELRDAFADYSSPNLQLDVLLTWGTTRVGWVSVEHAPRRIGKSNYDFWRLFNQLMLLLTGYSVTPLRFASLVGFVFTLVGLLMLIWVVVRAVALGSIPGFPFLASAIAIFSGAQLFALGIIGEYQARMFNRLTERPTYVIGETTNRPDNA
jgi:undecaprenyl-phosphate 4-deoxy-4-formamido-L-arabinose transferase